MSTYEKKEDDKCLNYGDVWHVKKICFRKSMLKSKAKLEIEVSFGGAKIRDDLR